MPYDAAEDFVQEAERVEALARIWLGPQAPYQVRLETPDAVAIADFLVPEGDGVRLIEVKASSTLKHIHLRDLAYQMAVAQQAGHTVRAVDIILVNKDFLRGAEEPAPAQVLSRLDVTAQVTPLLAQARRDIRRLARILREECAPSAQPGRFCKANRAAKDRVQPSACGHLLPGALCRRDLPADWAEQLPNLRGLARDRVDSLPFPPRCRELDPADVYWSDEQKRFLRAVAVGKPVFDRGGPLELLDETLQPVEQLPQAFLDFEFDPFVAIPRFQGMRPFQRLPFQWSMRRSDRRGEEFSFLHTGGDDPRRAFIESLLAALPPAGPIFVYSRPAEASVLERYVEDWFDGEYAARVQPLLDRLVDLLVIVKERYAHPDMRGSYSLKRVAPSLLGHGYEDLAIGDGLTALREWRRLASGAIGAEEARAVEAHLRAYCGRDAELMPRMLHELKRLAALGDLETI